MRKIACTVVAISSLSLFSFCVPSQAGADSLFKPGLKSLAQKRSTDPTLLQERTVSLNTGIVSRLQAARSGRSAGGRIDVELFNGRSVGLLPDSVTAGADGNSIVSAAGASEGEFGVFSVQNGKIAGYIESGGRFYLIDPTRTGDHVLREIKPSKFKRDKHMHRPKSSAGNLDLRERLQTATSDISTRATTTTYVDLLVAYTDQAKNFMTAGGATVGQIADRDIAIVNRGMKNSGIPIRIRRKGLKAVNGSYDEDTGSPEKPLLDLTSGSNANFPEIRNERNSVKADLVAMYVRQQPQYYCGIAWVNAPTPLPEYGYAVVDAACVGSVALAHELGHTMGLNHDRYAEGTTTSSYNYGFVHVKGNFRDIMSYPDKCFDRAGHDCALKTYYSSSTKYINGRRAGRPPSSKSAADATRWLKRKKEIIAGFR